MIARDPIIDRWARWFGAIVLFVLPMFSSIITFPGDMSLALPIGLFIGLLVSATFLFFVDQYRQFLRDLLFPINLLLRICLINYRIDHDRFNKAKLKRWCEQYLNWPAFYFDGRYYFFKRSDALAFKLMWIESIEVKMEFITV